MPQIARVRRCPICAGRQVELLFEQRFAGLPRDVPLQGYDVVTCSACGLAYADGIPGQQAFDSYYGDLSRYEYALAGGRQSESDFARFESMVASIAPHFPSRDARILEVGCATGGLLSLFRRQGYRDLLGVDPSPACARAAERLHGIRVLTGTLSELPAMDRPFDLVILAHVLEHVVDLAGALARVQGLLAPNGCLYAEVPDATRFSAALDAPFQEFSVEHVNFFSPGSLANLMAANGMACTWQAADVRSVSPLTSSPVAAGLFRRGIDARPLVPDTLTKPRLEAYIGECREEEGRVLRILAEVFRRSPRIAVWGVGTHTRRLLAAGGLPRERIACFVDSDRRHQGKELEGVPILAPEALAGRDEPVLISSRMHQQAIAAQARRDLGAGRELVLLYGQECA